jgi:UDP-GlcNAc:undecaprenyl-phosphate/decaprenyl-phosphate GlcNAc-1-phosphate transferase
VFLASAITVFLTTPAIRRLAIRIGAIDRPSDRKVHPKPTPTLGGVAILLGVLVGLGLAYLIPSFRSVYRESSELQGVLLAAVTLAVVGLIDDLRTISAPAKVAGQVLAAGLLILNGVELLFFWFPTQGTISLGSDLAVPLTVAWVLVMVNAINLIDGLDGLAAGIVVIAAGGFFVWAYTSPTLFGEQFSAAALICAVAAGCAVGFLPYNFYPARIFMGDSGSMLLGVLLAAATISGVGRTIQPSGGDIAAFSIPVLIPVIVLAVPLIDVAMAVVRRLRRGRPIFAPDKEHLHHQLREIGHTHRQAVLIMYLWSLLLAGSALAVTFINGRGTIGLILGGAVLAIGLSFIPRRIQESRRTRRAAREAAERPARTKPA